MRVEIHWIPQVYFIIQTPTFQKSRPACLKGTLSLTIDKKTIRMAAMPLTLPVKPIGSQSEAGNQIGDVLHAEE